MRGLSADSQKKLLLSIGSHRVNRPLSPVEVGEAVQASLNAGSSLHEVAEALHLEDTSVLTKFVRLLQLTPEVRHLVDWGRSDSTIGFTAASEVARIQDPQDQVRLCHACLEHQLGSAEMKQVVQLRKRSRKLIEECVKEVLRLRPRIQRVHVFLGAVTSPALRGCLATLTQAQRDGLLQGAIRRRFGEMGEFGCRLGTDGFTITGGEKVAADLSQGGTDFEATINNDLAETVSP